MSRHTTSNSIDSVDAQQQLLAKQKYNLENNLSFRSCYKQTINNRLNASHKHI